MFNMFYKHIADKAKRRKRDDEGYHVADSLHHQYADVIHGEDEEDDHEEEVDQEDVDDDDADEADDQAGGGAASSAN